MTGFWYYKQTRHDDKPILAWAWAPAPYDFTRRLFAKLTSTAVSLARTGYDLHRRHGIP